MDGWASIADLYRVIQAGGTLSHVGVGRRAYGARTGRDMGGRTTYLTLCSGRQIGGPWGYAADREGAVTCSRCRRLAHMDA